MHDFMQSLQMRWPVAATIGLSTQMMASAPIARPSLLTFWNSEIFSSSGQPASVTPNGLFLNEAAPRRRAAFFLQSMRARVAPLLVAPDAVVGLIERAGEIGARVGQLEALATSQMLEAEAAVAIAIVGD